LGRQGFPDSGGTPVPQSAAWLDWVRTAIDLADEAALRAASKPSSRRQAPEK
jgi:hypothetical protein